MKEIGGYIEFERFHGKQYHEGAIKLNSGRHCVEYLIRSRGIQKMYLPYFMCASVADICRKLGVQVAYYRIDRQFHPLLDRVCRDREWLYAVNYYGQLSDACLLGLQQTHGNLIVDNAQAFFQKPIPEMDTVYTCRKFFGVADGGYVYTNACLEERIEQDCSYDRMTFLMGRFEKTAHAFYPQYVENNDSFRNVPMKKMSGLTRNILSGIDYDRVRNARTENYAYLHRRLQDRNPLDLTIPDGAFMYPLYVENGIQVRKKLQERKLYIPTLWPDVFALCQESELEYDLAANILPLPVDQRYSIADMDEICQAVLPFLPRKM